MKHDIYIFSWNISFFKLFINPCISILINCTISTSIYRLIHGLFHIALVISTRPWYRRRGLMTRAIWKRACINLLITYFAKVDNMLFFFTRGQITCYCPRKMLLPQRQITRRKLCFYYTCKFGVISIKYVIRYIISDLEEIFKRQR